MPQNAPHEPEAAPLTVTQKHIVRYILSCARVGVTPLRAHLDLQFGITTAAAALPIQGVIQAPDGALFVSEELAAEAEAEGWGLGTPRDEVG